MQDLGPVPSKPFQHQPHTSSNWWQDTEVQVVAVTLIPTQQRYQGPWPAPPNTCVSWGKQSLVKTKGVFSLPCCP